MFIRSSLPQATQAPYRITQDTKLKGPIFHSNLGAIYHMVGNSDVVVKVYAQRLREDNGHRKRIANKCRRAMKISLHVQCVPEYESFLRELPAFSLPDHPHLVKAHAYGFVDLGRFKFPYVITQRVQGRDLQELIDDEKSPSEKGLIKAVIGAAKGLGYAHAHGILHKDVKPSNIMVDKSGNGIVLDFGCSGPNPELLLFDEAVLGTPDYVSPEQIGGEKLDQRTDIYSLGLVLYCASIGDIPFEESDELKLFKEKLASEIPDPLSVRPAMNPELARVIVRATKNDRRQRYSTMDDLIGDLERIRS